MATKVDREAFERLLSCLVEGNQAWAKAAPVLALGCGWGGGGGVRAEG